MDREFYDQICAYLESKKDEMITTLESVVNMESFVKEPQAVAKVAEKFKSLFEAEGVQCELVPTPPNGPTLLGVLGADRNKEAVLFSGHMDTVIKPGTYEQPVFRQEDGKAFGPGVLDMKGGIVIALYVIKALNSIGYNERPLKIAFSGDEENGHVSSNGKELLINAGKDAICAFNLETGLIDNSLCYGRKGRVEVYVTVHGVETHAGNDFLGGINAIAEMAEKITRIQKLTDLEKGTTVTCAVIEGGTISNAIPAKCRLELECRFKTASEMERFKLNLEEICKTAYVEGTTAEVVYPITFSPYECTDGVKKFWEFIKETAAEYGLEEVRGKELGGASDAAFIQMTGTPVICSIGIQGQWNHTSREYALLDSLVSRGKLISAAILNLQNFKGGTKDE